MRWDFGYPLPLAIRAILIKNRSGSYGQQFESYYFVLRNPVFSHCHSSENARDVFPEMQEGKFLNRKAIGHSILYYME